MEIFGKLGIDGTKLVFQVINFLIVLYFLNRWIYKPLLGVLDARRKEVEKTVLQAQKSAEDSKQAQIELEKELAQAREKAGEIVSRAQEQASETKKNAQTDAHESAQEIVASAKSAMEKERAGLLKEVQNDITKLVVATSSKVIGKDVEGKHDELIKNELHQG